MRIIETNANGKIVEVETTEEERQILNHFDALLDHGYDVNQAIRKTVLEFPAHATDPANDEFWTYLDDSYKEVARTPGL